MPFPRLAAALLFLLLLSGCPRQEEPAPLLIRLPRAVRELAYFREGTYWIYRNAQTQALDSVAVTESRIGIENFTAFEPPRILARNETFVYRTVSSADRRAFEYTSGIQCVGSAYDSTAACVSVGKHPLLPSGRQDETFAYHLYYQPIVGTRKLLSGNSLFRVERVWPVLMVAGTPYRNVIEMSHSLDLTVTNSFPLPTRHFMAPHVGMVRRDIQRNGQWESWELIRAHIVQ